MWPTIIVRSMHTSICRCQTWIASMICILHTPVFQCRICPAIIVFSIHTFVCRCCQLARRITLGVCIWRGICAPGKQCMPMVCSFSQIMHARTWIIFILEEMSANGMKHQPRPTYIYMKCVHASSNIGQWHLALPNPTRVVYVFCTSVVRLLSLNECSDYSLRRSSMRQYPMVGCKIQGLHALVVLCAHQHNDIDHCLRII